MNIINGVRNAMLNDFNKIFPIELVEINLLKEIQLNVQKHNQILEWIPYKWIEDIEYLDKGRFSTVHKAICLYSLIWWKKMD